MKITASAKPWIFLISAILLSLGLASCGEPKDTHPGQPVTHRKLAFKQMIRTLEPMGLEVRGRKPFNAEFFLKSALALQVLAKKPWPYFTPDSNYPPTRARPEVWQKMDKFKQDQGVLDQAIAKLVAAAKSGNLDTIRPVFAHVQDSCQSCHHEFRHS
ncbi:MAG: c-type cytochrome [Burkholderiales bacterium]|nr:cytochrome c [Sulfuricellaceae bacterium]